MKVSDEKVLEILAEVGVHFRTFGGGVEKGAPTPVSVALKDRPLQFAAGVEVEEVVRFVAAML